MSFNIVYNGSGIAEGGEFQPDHLIELRQLRFWQYHVGGSLFIVPIFPGNFQLLESQNRFPYSSVLALLFLQCIHRVHQE